MNDQTPNLKDNNFDRITSLAKGLLGAIPVIGSMVSEVAGTLIPNQRIDRIVRYVELLEAKLNSIPIDQLNELLNNESIVDLLEDGFFNAARANTQTRREYIANIIVNGIDDSTIDLIESKSVLRLLSEVNDIEVLWLRYYDLSGNADRDVFRNNHKEALTNIPVYANADDTIRSKAALQEYYKEHLVQLNLLESRYEIDRESKQQVIGHNGRPKKSGYSITTLGRVLLRQIGVISDLNQSLRRPNTTF